MTGLEPDSPSITLRNVTIGYAGRPVLTDVSIRIRPGSLVAVVGPNGGGKTTLLKTIAGELKPLSGSIERRRVGRGSIGFLPQGIEFERDFPIQTRDVVAMGLWPKLGLFGGIDARHAAIVEAALKAVGLTGFDFRPIAELSGGELQRVLFARLIATDSPIILLDEPFAGVDRTTVADLVAVIRAWQQEGRALIAALHDLDRVANLFPETIHVSEGHAAIGATQKVLAGLN